jgi:hypothetical protein
MMKPPLVIFNLVIDWWFHVLRIEHEIYDDFSMIFMNEIARNIPKNHENLDEITNLRMNTYRFGLKF